MSDVLEEVPCRQPRLGLERREQATLAVLLGGFCVFLIVFLLTSADVFSTPPRKKLNVQHLDAASADVIEYFVDINTATVPELQLLPGIGEVTATKIVEERQRNGRFRNVEDLRRVHGIGLKKVHSLKPFTLPVVPREVLVKQSDPNSPSG